MRTLTGMSQRRGIALAAFVALALVAATGTSAPASAAARDPCAFAQELLRAGLLRDAALHFHAAAKGAKRSQRPLRCAVDGLGAIRAIRRGRAQLIYRQATDGKAPDLPRRTARRLADAASTGEFDQLPHVVARAIADGNGSAGFKIALVLAGAHYPLVADRVVEATLAAHPGVTPPGRLHDLLLAARGRAAQQHLAAATALSRAGLDAQARSELETALKADPSLTVPDELASPTRREWWWNRWLGRWGPVIITFAEIAAVVLAVMAGILLLIRALRRFKARVRIAKFTGGPAACREATAAAVRENFGRLNDDAGGRRAKFVSSSGESFAAVPTNLVEAFPQATWVLDLITLLGALVPTRTRHVTAELRPRDPVRGAGLTITFGRPHGKVFDEETLWEADYGPPPNPRASDQSAYDGVALAAAAWLTFTSARYTFWRWLTRGRLPSWTGPRFRTFSVLGATDWRSYALFAAGADREQRYALIASGRRRREQRRIVRQCYREALGRDPGNRGAMFNLIGLRLQATLLSAPARRRALERLALLRGGTDRQRNLWYRIRYLEAVVRLRGPQPEPELALEVAVDLCASLLDELDRLEHRLRTFAVLKSAYRGQRRANRRKLLHALRPAALLLLACMLKAAGGSSGTGRAGAPLDDTTLRERLDAAQPFTGGAIVSALEQGPTPILHERLVAYARTFEPFLPNALYVLACYHARLRLWADAEHELHTAIKRDPPLGRAALSDETLTSYRQDLMRWQRLRALVRELSTA